MCRFAPIWHFFFLPLIVFFLLTGSISFGWSKLKQSCFYYLLEQTKDHPSVASRIHTGFHHVIKCPFLLSCCVFHCHWSVKVMWLWPYQGEEYFSPGQWKELTQCEEFNQHRWVKSCLSWWWVTQQRSILWETAQCFSQQDPRLWFVWERCPSPPLPWLMIMCLKSITCK